LRLLGVRVGALARLSEHLLSGDVPVFTTKRPPRQPDPHTAPLF